MKLYKIIISLFLISGILSCTDDFTEINTNPNAITIDEASARYFVTNPQFNLFAPDRFPYWRAHLIHADRYAGHFTFGFHNCWWSDELGYSYSSSYTGATWGWLAGYFGGLDNFLRLTRSGGDFENPLMEATGIIIKGLYYQMYTDIFGEIPYSESGNPDIVLPKYDTQREIYQGIIAELEAAMNTIGDNATTGPGVEDLGENDIYFGGDLQLWKKLANTLKLRLAIRAYGAPGADFASGAIQSALAAPLLEAGEDALMEKDAVISQWGSATYGDVWYNFGAGSDWSVGQTLIDALRDNKDPRLSKYAKPAVGGSILLTRPLEDANPDGYTIFPKHMDFIKEVLDKATGGDYVFEDMTDSVRITIPENKHYIGQPTRLNGKIKPFARKEFFSHPAEIVIQRKNQGQPLYPEIIITAAESYFLRAEAALHGFSGAGDAQTMYQNGIRAAMKLWKVSDGDIDTYLATDAGQLTGNMDEMLEKIAMQRWIAAYTDGFEAWAIVRKTGYPKALADGVEDIDIYGLGDINGDFPQRLRYGGNAYSTNGDNLNVAIGRQGPDVQNTKLWWAK